MKTYTYTYTCIPIYLIKGHKGGLSSVHVTNRTHVRHQLSQAEGCLLPEFQNFRKLSALHLIRTILYFCSIL